MLKISWKLDKEWLHENVMKINGFIWNISREDGGNGITFVHMLYTVFQYKRKSYDDMTGPQYISLASHVASVLNMCVLARRKWVKQKQEYLVRICQQVFSPLFSFLNTKRAITQHKFFHKSILLHILSLNMKK